MRRYGLAVDPGMSNGVCLFSWGDEQDEYFKQEKLWQFEGGAPALARFLTIKRIRLTVSGELLIGDIPLTWMPVEKFTPRSHEGFSLTQKSAEPLRGEGVLIGRGFETFIEWQEPSAQYFMGGINLPDRKKRSREFLKLHGLYVTGKLVGQKDANDAISAELHAIAFLRKRRHMPTLMELFGEDDAL